MDAPFRDSAGREIQDEENDRRLDGWKEIANYLGRSQGAVQRWEKKEGLPVHRHLHEDRASVYCYVHEIKAWQASRLRRARDTARQEETERQAATETGTTPPKPGVGLRTPRISIVLTVGAVLSTLVGALLLTSNVLNVSGKQPPPGLPVRAVPIKPLPGKELHPALSPDGERIAFCWRAPGSDNYDIYVRSVGDGEPVRLSSHPADEWAPRWSASAGAVSFVRATNTGEADIVVHSFRDGAEWVVGRIGVGDGLRLAPLEYVAGSTTRLYMLHRNGRAKPHGIEFLHFGTDDRKTVAAGRENSYGFLGVASSPDGGRLAAVQATTPGSQPAELVVRNQPDGPWKQLTQDYSNVLGLDWTPDGQWILFSSGRGQARAALWRIRADAPARDKTAPQKLVEGNELRHPQAVAVGSRVRVVYEVNRQAKHLWRKNLGTGEPAVRITSGDFLDREPAFSEDAQSIVFVSDRSGKTQLWAVDREGRNLRKITDHKAWVGGPSWAGGAVLYRMGNHVMALEPGMQLARAQTHGYRQHHDQGSTSDGKSIYYVSDRSGSFQVWTQPLNHEDQARQVTKIDGQVNKAYFDAQRARVYFTHVDGDPPGLWMVPLGGGARRQILPAIGRWKIRGGTLFHSERSGGKHRLLARDLNDGKSRSLLDVAGMDEFDVSQDGKWVVWAAGGTDETDVGMIEFPQE